MFEMYLIRVHAFSGKNTQTSFRVITYIPAKSYVIHIGSDSQKKPHPIATL